MGQRERKKEEIGTLAIATLDRLPSRERGNLGRKKIIKMLQSMSISDREINLGVRKRD